MFGSIGWGELLVLILIGLFVLGPDRLPEGAAWLGRTVRKVKEYATGAREQIRSELGPEFDELQKPLEDLRSIRSFNPRTAVRRELFDATTGLGSSGSNGSAVKSGNGSASASVSGGQRADAGERTRPLAPGEQPPYDAEAT